MKIQNSRKESAKQIPTLRKLGTVKKSSYTFISWRKRDLNGNKGFQFRIFGKKKKWSNQGISRARLDPMDNLITRRNQRLEDYIVVQRSVA